MGDGARVRWMGAGTTGGLIDKTSDWVSCRSKTENEAKQTRRMEWTEDPGRSDSGQMDNGTRWGRRDHGCNKRPVVPALPFWLTGRGGPVTISSFVYSSPENKYLALTCFNPLESNLTDLNLRMTETPGSLYFFFVPLPGAVNRLARDIFCLSKKPEKCKMDEATWIVPPPPQPLNVVVNWLLIFIGSA